jgi:hypothetical protein
MTRISLASLSVAPLLLIALACRGVGPTESQVSGRKSQGDGTLVALSQLPPPTNCTLQKIPPPSGYLKVAWTNGDASASTEVSIWHNGVWNVVSTESPGISQYFYILGGQTGQFFARVRHVKAGFDPSNYCTTGSVTV